MGRHQAICGEKESREQEKKKKGDKQYILSLKTFANEAGRKVDHQWAEGSK